MLASIDLPITIYMLSPLHIGTGCARGLVDRTVMRDGEGNVYLPGSSLKGRLRDACERLAGRYGLHVCHAPRATDMCRIGSPCLVCRVFGTPGRESGLIIDNGRLSGEWAETVKRGFGQTESRTQVQISRARGVAAEGRLFTSEFAAEGLVFETRISGQMDVTLAMDEPGLYCETLLLLGGVKMVETLGGGNSRGIGACRVELPEVFTIRSGAYGTEQINVTDTLTHLEFLECFTDPKKGGTQ